MVRIKAIILCAGYATRLYPLTKNNPKPLIEIAGRNILEHIIYKIEEIKDVDGVFIVTNNRFYKSFLEWSKNFKSNKPIKIINDKTNSNEGRLGAIGDIDFAIKNEDINDDVLIIAGDNLFEFSLLKLHDFFNTKKNSVIALYDIANPEIAAGKLGVVSLDKEGKIIDFEEKPKSPKSSIISTACYIIQRKDIKLLERCIDEQNKPDNLGDFISWLSKNHDIYGHVFREKWFDIGSLEQLEKARGEFGL